MKILLKSNSFKVVHSILKDECSTLVKSFNSFFIKKITKIHESIANILASSPISPFLTRQFSVLQSLSSEEVLKLIHSLPNESSPLDSLYFCAQEISSNPYLSKLASVSFSTGIFPSICKRAQVLPILKSSVFLQKLLFQTSSTISLTYMARAIAPLGSVWTSWRHLTLSSTILSERFKSNFGIDDLAFSWIQSYLFNRIQYVNLGDHSSTPVELLASVPQGSGPILSNHSMSDQLGNLQKCTDATNEASH